MVIKKNDYTEGHVKKNISPSTQRIDFGLRAIKTYSNTESRARCKEDSWEATDNDIKGYNQEGTSICSGQTPV